MEIFWAGHDPTHARSSQYRAELYCDDAESFAIAQQSAQDIEAKLGRPLATRILSGKPFYPAEAYHQKWALRQHRVLWRELVGRYPTESLALASVAAAKLNAYVAGQAERPMLDRDIPRFDLSASATDHLRSVASR